MLHLIGIRRPGTRFGVIRAVATACGLAAVFGLAAAAYLPAGGGAARAAVAPSPMTDGWTKVVTGGLTDPNNSFAAFGVEFKGALYVSTIANEAGSVFSGSRKVGGEIWRSEDGLTWKQIGTPGLGNVRNSTFRLVIFKDTLYAVSDNLNDHGVEVWASSDGLEFNQIETPGFRDIDSSSSQVLVFNDRLLVGVANTKTGAQIWVSDDGQSFRQAVAGGMGNAKNTGISLPNGPRDAGPVFQGRLYVGVSNPTSGGEIWRTADGLRWERVAEAGLGRSTNTVITPGLVFEDRLYAVSTTGGSLDTLTGLEVFRTSDGATWEKVVSDGFSVGPERNIGGQLMEFKDRLFLVSDTMDPRLLIPSQPSERLAPRGFQLRVTTDGKQWTQVGKDGFGADSSLYGALATIGGTAYLAAYDYHLGDQLWRSTDGDTWELVFREPVPSWFSMGGGLVDFGRHLYWVDNDLKRGVEVWRTDDMVVAEATTTTLSGGTSATTVDDGSTQTTAGGTSDSTTSATSGADDGGGGAGGLSSGSIVLIIVLAAVAGAAIVGAVVMTVILSRRPR